MEKFKSLEAPFIKQIGFVLKLLFKATIKSRFENKKEIDSTVKNFRVLFMQMAKHNPKA